MLPTACPRDVRAARRLLGTPRRFGSIERRAFRASPRTVRRSGRVGDRPTLAGQASARSSTRHRVAVGSSRSSRSTRVVRVDPSPALPRSVRQALVYPAAGALPDAPMTCLSGASRPVGGGPSTREEVGTSCDLSAPVRLVRPPGVPSSPSCETGGRPGSWPRNSTAAAIRPHSWSPLRSPPTASSLSGRQGGRGRRLGSSSREWSPRAGRSLQRSGRTGTRFPCGDQLALTGGRSLQERAREARVQSAHEVVAAALTGPFLIQI
jgi:hypothetical protein